MIRYMVMVKWKHGIADEDKDTFLDQLDATMTSGPYSYEIVRDLALQAGTADYALLIDFNSETELANWNAPSREHASTKALAAGRSEAVMVMAYRVEIAL